MTRPLFTRRFKVIWWTLFVGGTVVAIAVTGKAITWSNLVFYLVMIFWRAVVWRHDRYRLGVEEEKPERQQRGSVEKWSIGIMLGFIVVVMGVLAFQMSS